MKVDLIRSFLYVWSVKDFCIASAELAPAGGNIMIDVLTEICNKVWRREKMVYILDVDADYSNPKR